jgi:spore coat polysaccharide biosynthesis protein SpsF
MKIAAVIQARLNSSRLKGKVLKKIYKNSVIDWQISRLKKSKLITDIIIATTSNKIDDKLVNYLNKKYNIKIFRGSENDVLDRVCLTLKKFKVDVHVECFGDSPLIDPLLIDDFILTFLNNKYSCVSNSFKKTYPAGQEILVYKSEDLFYINSLLKKNDPLREHVGFNFIRFKKNFNIFHKKAKRNYFGPNIYLEVDTKKDLKFLNLLIESMSKKKISLSLNNIIKFLKKNNGLQKINTQEKRNWKILNEKYK